jgi:hypothetical protein
MWLIPMAALTILTMFYQGENMTREENEKSWIPTIKITTLLYTLLVAMAGGYLGAEYQALKSAAIQSDMQALQQAGFTDKPQLPVFIDSTQQGVY